MKSKRRSTKEFADRMKKVARGLEEGKILCFSCLAECENDFFAYEVEKGKKMALCPKCSIDMTAKDGSQ